MFQSKNKLLLSGNEATALGALRAGLKFYAAYPMTPASSILHFLAAHEKEYKIITKHTEDEIAAINMVIGASVAGARAMCATSGGGFALMAESLGFGGIIETPFVIAVAMRPGPATGLPTWSGQGDLRFVMHAGQDEFPRIILAPGTVEECFKLAYQAFSLADAFQVPVIILIDKFLGESQTAIQLEKSVFKTKNLNDNLKLKNIDTGQAIQNNNKIFKRYQFTKTGISPRALPGTPNKLFIANSDEHDEFGYSEEDANNRIKMTDKRMRKLESIVKILPEPKWYGPDKADLTLITWGSQLGPALETLKTTKQPNQQTINILHFSYLYPLPIQKILNEVKKIKKSQCLKNNYSGVFADYLFEKTGFKVDEKLLKYDGRPFFADLLKADLRKLLHK